MLVNPDLFVKKRDEAAQLFNAVKNRRRVALLELLAQRGSRLAELQHGMRKFGFDHSQSTILGYLRPLLDAGLAQAAAGSYALTNRGWAALEALAHEGVEATLPADSNCDEEFLLMALEADDGSYEKLLGPRPGGDFGRTARRLENLGFLRRERPASRAIYQRGGVEPTAGLSFTERRVYGLIPEQGATVHDLSEKASISVRRTFRYLRMLREKRLIYAQKSTAKLVLTPKGKDYASLLIALSRVLESPVEPTPADAQSSFNLSATELAGAIYASNPEVQHQVHELHLILGGERPPCDLLKPLDIPGLSGQKLYRCDRYNLAIGENAGICETCDH